MEFDEMLLKRKERIKEYINSENYLPLKRHELAVMLDVPAADINMFNSVIDSLISEGSAVETKKGKIMLYSLKKVC